MTNTIFGKKNLNIAGSYRLIDCLDYDKHITCSIHSSDVAYWLELKLKNTNIRVANVYVGRISAVASKKCLEDYADKVDEILKTRDSEMLAAFLKPMCFDVSISVIIQYLNEVHQTAEQHGRRDGVAKVRSLLGL